MLKRLLVYLFIYGFVSLGLFASENLDTKVPDSLLYQLAEIENDSQKVDYLIDKSWSFARTNPDLSFSLLSVMDSIIISSGTDYGLDVLYYYKGIINKNLGDYKESEKWLKKYYDFHNAKGNQPHKAVVTMALANLYSDQGDWARSMNSVTESLALYNSLKDSLGIIRSSSKLGYILTKLNRYEDALEYHQSSRKTALAIGNNNERAIAHSNIGNTYEEMDLLDSAYVHYLIAEGIDEQYENQWGLVYDKTQLGRILMKKGKHENALTYAKEAYLIAQELGAPSLTSMSQLLLGTIYVKNEQYNKGIALLSSIINDQEYKDAPLDLKEAHQSLYIAYKSQGDIKKAFEHLEQYNELSEQLLNKDITEQINSLEIVYKTEQKEQEIALLNSQNEVALLQLQAANRRNIAFGIGLLLFAILSFFLYRIFQKIQSQNKIITKAYNEKDILLREIHHRVKNNLQFVSSLLNLQSRHIEDENALTALKEGQNRVKSMALIHQNLYQEDNLTGIYVDEYLKKLTSNLFNSYNISPDRIMLEMDIHNVNLDVDTIIPLGLIINELISNALKHAFPDETDGRILIELKEINNELILRVIDNGVGLNSEDESQLKQSFGYRLINAFKSQLDAELDIEGSNGTVVEMRIKDYQKVA